MATLSPTDESTRPIAGIKKSLILLWLLLGILLVLSLVIGSNLVYVIDFDGERVDVPEVNIRTMPIPSPTVTPMYNDYFKEDWNKVEPFSYSSAPRLLQWLAWTGLILGLVFTLGLVLWSFFLALNGPLNNHPLSLVSTGVSLLAFLAERVSSWINSDAGSRSHLFRSVFWIVGTFFGLLGLAILLAERQILGPVVLFLLMASVFPISYFSYVAASDNRTYLEFGAHDRGIRPQPLTVDRLTLDFLLATPEIVGTNTQTIEAYRKKAEAYYDRVYSSGEYYFYVALNIFLTLFGALLFFWPQETAFISVETVRAMQFGFLGAYLFSFQLIYRRYANRDLQPAVYMYSARNLIAGLIFNFIAFQALTNLVTVETSGEGNPIGMGALAIISFSLGYFPHLAISWFDRIAHDALAERGSRTEQMALEMIDGISPFHETRLHEAGIDNVQNLASADLFALLTSTNFGSQELVDWIDQAILYMHLDPGSVAIFRRAKIRTASNYWNLWESLIEASDKNEQKREKISLQLQTLPEHLDMLFTAIHKTAGPNVTMVMTYWANKNIEGELETKIRLAKSEELEEKIQKDTKGLQSQYNVLLHYIAEAAEETIQKEDLRHKAERLRNQYWRLTGGPPTVDPKDTLAIKGRDKLADPQPSPGSGQSEQSQPPTK